MAKQKSWNNYYEIIDELGEGGNAKVYRVKCKEDNEEYALKDLVVGGEEKHSRFVNEINTIKDNYQKIDGIIPIYKFSVDGKDMVVAANRETDEIAMYTDFCE